jgi:uncharacterized membrane protein YraQ (UPF0718 family)
MEFLKTLWNYIIVSAPFLMLGMLAAGFIHAFITEKRIQKAMGGKSLWTVVKAAVLGIPLPLCSCAVIPTAVTLKKNGANNAATSSFLISTPESGVDSIAMTYAMMDLPMTIIRPVSAFLSALVAGILQFIFNPDTPLPKEEAKSCCPKTKCGNAKPVERDSLAARISKMFKFGFFELMDDLGEWLALGLLIGAMIEFFIPPEFFAGLNGLGGRFIILLIGIPMYICASATTPIAASLVLKGMSPGTSLLILLVGPATNISNILVLQKYIGKKGILINIFTIAFVALIMSFVVDYIYTTFALPLDFNIGAHEHEHGYVWWKLSLAIAFTLLLSKSLLKALMKRIKK